MSSPLRVACVGAGYFSQFHLGSWARMAGARVAGICDIDPEAAKKTGVTAFGNLREMIAQTTPDIVDIILPPQAQRQAIETALAAGVKTIICQKPFCGSLREAEQMAQAAEQQGARLIVHENFRFMPWYRFIKTALEQGKIGQVLQASFRLRPGDGQGAQAYLDRQPYFQKMDRFLVQETAVHWVDTFRYLLGAPTAVYADLRQINPAISGEDAGIILFDHPRECCVLFDGNRHLDHASDNLRRTMGEALFEGTRGTLELFGDGRVEHRAFGASEAETVLPPDDWVGFGGDCVHALQSHVVEVLTNGGKVENDARDYCEVLRIRDAIYRSARSGSKVSL